MKGGGDWIKPIATCLFGFLQAILPENIREVIFYSDTCSGQNKNSYDAAMFMSVISRINTLDAIHHKFLVSGHTHMECDVIHAMIERKQKMSGSLQPRKVNEDGEIFKWHDAQCLMYTKEPGIVNYKTALNEDELFKGLSYR
ncbi:hypothetical protein PR048_026733 [Dryococelus australis]|uniref:DUF7869 domain-containing protein n=1 Tax=Dryococelus australis TaxID=614101 RepID=A0ABQ9GM73_9NEOP|nr:hypothetical protein PR048_026733 [Dryococelus australis]